MGRDFKDIACDILGFVFGCGTISIITVVVLAIYTLIKPFL